MNEATEIAAPQASVAILYWCEGCSTLHEDDEVQDAGPTYECSGCGTRFNRANSADGGSARCPDCNKFAARQTDVSCPEGNCDEDLEEVGALECNGTVYVDIDFAKERMG